MASLNPTSPCKEPEIGNDNKYTQHDLSLDALLEYPTEEEFKTLRRVPDTLPWRMYLVAYTELAERFSYRGCAVVFTNFIQQPLPAGSRTGAGGLRGQSGALGMGQMASTGLITFNNFWSQVTPLAGGYIADAYLGRFSTIVYSVYIILLGHIILIISAIPQVIVNKPGALACFIISIIIMGIGAGGFKSNVLTLIAEQRDSRTYIRTEADGERVIVDPGLTVQRIYMCYYLYVAVGSLVGKITMPYAEKFVGFWLAYTLPTIVLLTVPFLLYFGRDVYVRTPPAGSMLSSCIRLLRCASRGCWSWNPIRTYRNLKAPDFWERAKLSNYNETEGERPIWMTWDDAWVDEIRRGFKACAVFVWFPIFWLTYNQLNNNLTSQAAAMNTHGLPNDVLQNLEPIVLIIFIPIFDMILYPLLQRSGIRFTPIKKITIGFFLGAGAMAWAAIVQHYIYKTSPCGKSAATCKEGTSPITVWAQAGCYVLIAFSEIFASIAGQEYAFTKAPKNMRSLVMALFLLTSAIAYALGEAFVALSNDPLLIWNYGSMSVLACVSGIGFWLCFRHLDKEEEELNDLREGKLVIQDNSTTTTIEGK